VGIALPHEDAPGGISLEAELEAAHPELGLDIIMVNAPGLESGNSALFGVTTLPVVQDDATANVWLNWGAVWRDVYVLDRSNHVTAVYNLSAHGLSDPANYAELYDLFVAAGTD
jgi:hypothetical protein